MNRLEVREQILTCRNCELCKVGSGPVPFSGPTPARVVVMAEAPGQQEDSEGVPLIGRAGQVLRENMAKAGLDISQMMLMNSASCFPKGTPTADHLAACRPNVEAQLTLAQPEWVLLLGGVALSVLRSDLRMISRARRHVFMHNGIRWFATFHPSAAMRQRKTEELLLSDLCLFAEMLNDDSILGSVNCVVCGVDENTMSEHDLWLRFDEMGASFCNACWDKREADLIKLVQDKFPGSTLVES